MKRATQLLALMCCWVPCLGEERKPDPGSIPREIPTFDKQDSPATLLKENADGTFLVTLTPHVYFDELGCTMVSDERGNTFSKVYFIIAFTLDKSRYWTIWGSRPGESPPVKLDPKKEYKCLVKPLDSTKGEANRPCSIMKIWDGEKLLFERTEKGNAGQGEGGQPATPPRVGD
jgi:hypothetical protein